MFNKLRVTFISLFFLFLFFSEQGLSKTSSVAFIAFGDSGLGNSDQKKVAATISKFCATEQCDFVALLGDNIYPSGVESVDDPQWQTKFEKPYASLKLKFYPTLGNHDYKGNPQAQIDYSDFSNKWKFPSRYYSYKRKFVEFFVIDSEVFDDEQELWLKEKIALSEADWKIVYGHKPIYSHGFHGDTPELKEKLLPLLRNKVDFYFSGHDHNLEYLYKGYSPHFVVSGAGSETRPVGKGKSTLFSASELGFGHLILEKEKAVFRFIGQSGDALFKKVKSSER